ncbi:MAG: hypothetical protein AB4041_08605 [Microcystaceae cyanobacterium]
MRQPTDDDTLVTFLKTYQPSVPPESMTLENRLMAEISRHPRRKNKRLALFALGSIILAGLTIGGTIWQRNTLSPQVAISVEDLENFLVEGWEETLEASSGHSVNDDWFLLEDSTTESLDTQNY